MSRSDSVKRLGIDEAGSLWVMPSTARFPMIYREAMEVHWDDQRGCLFSPKPREWSYADWFRHIVAAAQEQGTTLSLTDGTTWSDIDPVVMAEIKATQL